MFRNIYPEGNRFRVITVDESRDARLEGLGGLGREQPGQAALLTWGDRRVRFEYDVSHDFDADSGRRFNWYFFLREGVGEQYLKHANVSTWGRSPPRIASRHGCWR